jgi:hypothetical protein
MQRRELNHLVASLATTKFKPFIRSVSLHFVLSCERVHSLVGMTSRFQRYCLLCPVFPESRYWDVNHLGIHSMFRSGASSSAKEGSVFLYRRYACCSVVSALVHLCCQGVQVTMDACIRLHCPTLNNIHARYQRLPVNENLCSRLRPNLCNNSETAVSQLKGHRPNSRQD